MTTEDLYQLYKEHRVICTDSRNVTQGCLFFALKGESFDGNAFASKAIGEGAAFAVIDNPEFSKGEKYLLVDDVLQSLQQLALYHRLQLSVPVIAITGTNGKTTTKELFKSVLSQQYHTSATAGNLNNHIGVPLTLLSIDSTVEIAIVEMGANHQKEIEFLCTIARPTHGLITNVGKAHLEGFGGFEGVKKAKGELYEYLRNNGNTVFLNSDNSHLKEMYGAHSGEKLILYGNGEGSVVNGRIVENDPLLTVEWQYSGKTYTVKTHLTGAYNLENILAAIVTGLHFGLSPEQVNKGIRDYVPGNNRSQIVLKGSNTVICDYYNANPSSMHVALENLGSISAAKKVIILGDMFELGEEAAAEHKGVLEKAMTLNTVESIFIGPEFFRYRDDYKGRFFESVREAADAFAALNIQDAVVLVKGSRGMKLEQLVSVL